MTSYRYPTRQLGRNGPLVSAIALGVLSSAGVYGTSDETNIMAVLSAAADRGLTFWDTADIYGTTERSIGAWFANTGRRSEIFLSTKFGAVMPADLGEKSPTSTPSYIRQRLQNSLKELQTDYIDLLYQHRVDPKVPVEVIMETLRPYVESGTVRYIGFSECSIDHLRRAKAVPGIGEKVIACQIEFSPFERGIETSGFASAAREAGIGITAYSALGRGLATGCYSSHGDFGEGDIRGFFMPRLSAENIAKNLTLVEDFRQVANKYGATPGQVALAWLLAEHLDFIPVISTKSVEHLEENAKAAELVLSPEDVKQLRVVVETTPMHGTRYPDFYLKTLGIDSAPLSEWKGE
ncbi:NADP-dependent oxidoreductase domain-containing protein [Fomitopsis serialis]|uniref:NADP-dependent oxidoreductase domain-containing protein n=1 Tax=Fomitopsis serialis TaxID=139415 RepID=UPI00200835F0|nr:NADP-dependent oxidoreductase domain-containing protein [Neoantrodia serialis]KAH9921859.1 NADP-dependent oxidoreductase domain-containing protein [Neoantrodia serialis]